MGWRDMALLGVIAEAMQPFEDLAYLATAWDKPFPGLAHYVRATVYSSRTPTNFWQGASRWPNDRLAVFADLSARDPSTGQISDILDALGIAEQVTSEQREVLGVARHATIARSSRFAARPLLPCFQARRLAKDWRQYSPSIAIWRRGRSEPEAFGDFNLSPGEIVDQASRAGRLCRSLVDAFAESRVRIFDALELDENGEVAAFHPTHVPWTHWLRPADLTEDQWNVIAAGPKLTWVADHENA